MNKKIFLLSILLFLLVSGAFSEVPKATINSQSMKLPCSCDDYDKPNCNKSVNNTFSKDKPRFWTEKNINYLSDSEQKQLITLQEKIKSGVKLTEEERKQMWSLKDVVVKAILGDEKFVEFKNIMTKKKSGQKLTDDEVVKMKSYFNEIRGN